MQRRFEVNDPKLEQARNAVAAWRARRARLGPMPERLWRAAAALARRYGVSRISSELQVNYARLRADSHIDCFGGGTRFSDWVTRRAPAYPARESPIIPRVGISEVPRLLR
mgnify:FL=1